MKKQNQWGFRRIGTNGVCFNQVEPQVEPRSFRKPKFRPTNFIKAGLTVLISVLVIFTIVIAAPPGSPYLPGEEPNPTCAPGDPNCTVYAPAISTRNINTTSPLLGGGDLSVDRTFSLAGLSSLGTANYILGVNSGATGWEYKNLLGTANQISVSHAANSITLATPQDIHTGASPTFTGLTVGSLAGYIKGTAGALSGQTGLPHTDLTYSGLTAGNVLRASGTTAASFSAIQAGDLPTGIDALKIGTGVVDNTEFGYLDGVTSAIQTQLNGKEPTISAGTTAQYWQGDKSWQTLNQAAVAGLTITSSPQFANVVITAGGDIKPSSNTTTAINIAQADGTNFVSFDTTNKRVGIGTTPAYKLDVNGDFRLTGELSGRTMMRSGYWSWNHTNGDSNDKWIKIGEFILNGAYATGGIVWEIMPSNSNHGDSVEIISVHFRNHATDVEATYNIGHAILLGGIEFSVKDVKVVRYSGTGLGPNYLSIWAQAKIDWLTGVPWRAYAYGSATLNNGLLTQYATIPDTGTTYSTTNYYNMGNGWTGNFLTGFGQTVTVVGGIITSVTP